MNRKRGQDTNWINLPQTVIFYSKKTRRPYLGFLLFPRQQLTPTHTATLSRKRQNEFARYLGQFKTQINSATESNWWAPWHRQLVRIPLIPLLLIPTLSFQVGDRKSKLYKICAYLRSLALAIGRMDKPTYVQAERSMQLYFNWPATYEKSG